MEGQQQDPVVGNTPAGGSFSRSYIAIDLKSFYASVECADRKLDPLTANLVTADQLGTIKSGFIR